MITASWGRSERYKFAAAGSLMHWSRDGQPGLYVITYRQDGHTRPNSHTVLYFGESSGLSQDDRVVISDVLETWAEHGGTPDELYVFVRPMPGSSKSDRARIQRSLVEEYNPKANLYCR